MNDWTEISKELAAKRIERRTLLKGALGLSVLAMLETNKIARALVKPYGPTDATKIDTIVVTLMENRSLDHYFGWMGEVIEGRRDLPNPKSLAPFSCTPVQPSSSPTVYAVDNATPIYPYHLEGHCLNSDPNHGWDGSRVEFNGGAMNGFYERSGIDAMGYYDKEDIPILGWMAENYTTFSHYFSSVMGPTYPNRLYWLSGQGGKFKGNTIPYPGADGDQEPDGHDWASIFHQLDDAGIPWTYYHHDLATVMLFFNRVEENPGKVRFITDYYADAAAGVLTPIVFIDPGFVTVGNDDHPARDIRFGQRYIYDTFLALAQSPHWYNPSTGKGSVYVISYDEAGGFFDHVPPPRVTDPNASADHCQDWGRLGFRVPTVVASPFSRGPDDGGPTGVVNQNLFDHTSILKFIQWRFGLSSLNEFAWTKGLLPFSNGLNYGSRDSAPEIHNLNEVLDFDNPVPTLPAGLPETFPVHAQGLYCSTQEGDNPLEPLPDPSLPPLARPNPPAPLQTQAGQAHQEWADLADRGFFGKYDFRERAAKNSVLRD